MTEFKDVLVIGAGLTGLATARVLAMNSVNYLVLEQNSDVGGRMRSEVYEDCILDHGFQVVLPAYPSVRALKLSIPLKPFSRAASCFSPDGHFVVADPIHHPVHFIGNLSRTKSMIPDYFRMVKHIFSRRFDLSTEQILETLGYSESFKSSFLKPFLRGVLLDPTLDCPSPLSSYFLEQFFYGGASLVQGGIREFPRAIAENLDIRFHSEVPELSQSEFKTSDGKSYAAKIIVDTRPNANQQNIAWHGTHCHYFLSSKPVPFGRRITLCSTDLPTCINQIANLSEVDLSYSPNGTALLSVTSRGEANFEVAQIQRELASMLELPESQVNHLKSVHVEKAVPVTKHLSADFPEPSLPIHIGNTIFASDTFSYGSQHAALRMGEQAGKMATDALKI